MYIDTGQPTDVNEMGFFYSIDDCMASNWPNSSNPNINPWFQVEGRNDDKTMKHMEN